MNPATDIFRWFFSTRNKGKFFSQDGEDYLLHKIFEAQEKGYYVDVGSAHPVKESNTFYFYKKGWRGICVDPTPGLGILYRRFRPHDIFVNRFVSNRNGKTPFFLFNEPLLNTGNLQRKKFLAKKTSYELLKKIKVPRTSLAQIFEQHLPTGRKIDFLSLDVEQSELEVLQSNLWTKFRPQLIIMEVLRGDRENIGQEPAVKFLKKHGYRITTILRRSVFFSKE